MGVFLITTPDGKKYKVTAPDAGAAYDAVSEMLQPPDPAKAAAASQADWTDPAMQGLMMGGSDEFSGVMGAIAAPFRGRNMGDEYVRERDLARNRLDAYREKNPGTATAAEIGGSLLPAVLTGGGSLMQTGLGAAMKQGAKTGALMGGGYGGLSADGDLGDRAIGAVSGALAGGVTGAAFPVISRGVGAATKAAKDALMSRLRPADYAARKVVERAGGTRGDIERIGRKMDRGARQGTPLNLMDAGGENLRDLGRTIMNVPGPAKTRMTTIGNLGAMAQGDRLKALIGRTIADPEGFMDAKDAIMAARANRASPYYKRAFKTPVDWSPELRALLDTPAGRAALVKAKTNAANRQQPLSQWFAQVADDGTFNVQNIPGIKELHEVKRELDTMVNGAYAPANSPFGHPTKTPSSDAIKNVRDGIRDKLFRAGETMPGTKDGPYAVASRIAGDSIKGDQALEFGRKVFDTDSRIVTKRLRGMSDFEREMARVGAAEAVRKRIDGAGFTHNAILKFFSTRSQVNSLRPFFRRNEDWTEFRNTIFNEARRRRSYDVQRGNSTTMKQLNDMMDAGKLGQTVDNVGTFASAGAVRGAVNMAVNAVRRVSGITPATADEMSRILMARDPMMTRDLLSRLARIEASKASKQERANAVRQLVTGIIAGQEGGLLGSLQHN